MTPIKRRNAGHQELALRAMLIASGQLRPAGIAEDRVAEDRVAEILAAIANTPIKTKTQEKKDRLAEARKAANAVSDAIRAETVKIVKEGVKDRTSVNTSTFSNTKKVRKQK